MNASLSQIRSVVPRFVARAEPKDPSEGPIGETFPLLRYYLGTSLAVIATITIVVAFLFVKRAEADFSRHSTERAAVEAAHLVQILYYSLWEPRVELEPDLTLQDTIEPAPLKRFVRGTTFGLDIVGLEIRDVDGSRLWSTVPGTVDNRIVDSATFQTFVSKGVYESALLRDVPWALADDTGRRLDVIRSLYPMRDAALDGGQEGSVIGVLEVIKDVTAPLAKTRRDALWVAVLGSVGTGAVLFALLFLIVYRADRIITQGRKRLAETRAKHVESAKLAALGELVSGVAHELNNPLTSIWGLSQLLVSKDVDKATGKRHLRIISSEAERTVGIVQNLLSFARGGTGEMSYVSINEAVEAVLDLRKYELNVNSIALKVSLQPDLPMTLADPHKIQQVALNLIVNAEQAMTESKVGDMLYLKTERADDVIRLVVADNGPGIPEKNVERIFDPFFTTKDVGKGTGLGLSICYGIVQEHGGSLRVTEESPHGTRFTVELPIVAERGVSRGDSTQ